jgi:hypothetical protein
MIPPKDLRDAQNACEIEMKEKKNCVEDALHATRAAVEVVRRRSRSFV